jgi:hypothetical protein
MIRDRYPSHQLAFMAEGKLSSHSQVIQVNQALLLERDAEISRLTVCLISRPIGATKLVSIWVLTLLTRLSRGLRLS